MSDFKELIPEFYDVTRNDFLINKKKINFGQRWDGSIVNDVKVGVRSKKKSFKPNKLLSISYHHGQIDPQKNSFALYEMPLKVIMFLLI